MSMKFRLVNAAIKGLTGFFCRIDEGKLSSVPTQGPFIVIGNHINFLEVPLVYTRLMPRQIVGLVKKETMDSFSLGWLFKMWGGISIRRGEADLDAIHESLEALKAGKILGLSPEGTRSGTGKLGRAHPGVVVIALKSGAPLLPVLTYGGERFYRNLVRLHRTDVKIIVGRPFYLDTRGRLVTREMRQKMVDEIMYQVAVLLPPEYRGVYSDAENATQEYIRWQE